MAPTTQAGNRSAPDRLRELIKNLSFTRARDGEAFVLASGEKSDYFFDLKKTMLDGEGIDLLAGRVLEEIKKTGAHHVGGLAMGAVPIVVAAVMKSHGDNYQLQGFWIRKEQKDHGTRNKADGHLVPNTRVVIVEDVTTKGGSVMTAVNEARGRGCHVDTVVTIVDREQGAKELLKKNGINLISLYTRGEFFE